MVVVSNKIVIGKISTPSTQITPVNSTGFSVENRLDSKSVQDRSRFRV